MKIIIKNKDTLIYDDFVFKCCVGKNGFIKNKIEGDKKTPIGTFFLDCIYYRQDKKPRPKSKLKTYILKKNMGWCNDSTSKKNYNKLINTNLKLKHEKLFRKDYKYDYLIPIKYNWYNRKMEAGSAIFIHITKNYKPTAGCIGLTEKDFLILVSLINKNTKIKIF